MRILVTGAAGFIGAHVMAALQGWNVELLGLDNFNDYYSVELKRDRCLALGVSVIQADIADKDALFEQINQFRPTHIVHLAAQAGVRHSIHAPYDYLHSNLTGFLNVLEAARAYPPAHLVFASTSSIYGAQKQTPFDESMSIRTPLSLYSASKGANELMAHSYAHLYGLPCTALRFFTVYGAWGRPDMAPILFGKAICSGQAIEVFNAGDMLRDFTHVDDIVRGILGALTTPPRSGQNRESGAPYAVYNLGAGRPVVLNDFIESISHIAGVAVIRQDKGMQPGDMQATFADTAAASAAFGYEPQVGLEQGITQLVHWLKSYYQL